MDFSEIGLFDCGSKPNSKFPKQEKLKASKPLLDSVIKVSEKVTLVSDSSTDTSRKAQESANSIAKLLELAKDLETSVSRFKLPAS